MKICNDKPFTYDLYMEMRDYFTEGNKHLLGEWKVDERKVFLEEQLIRQYKLVEDMSNYRSAKSWKEFYDSFLGSYSKEEIKQCRKLLQQRGVNYD